ncbi:MAG: inorganic phosphate transporter [Parachlamydiaceae bacterium]|nr:inorganic phosphate transporter [Parachlamydiaceae bacterium]
MEIALFTVILLAGFYLAWNIGANDVANAMGTSVGSGALTLRRAVLIAAVLEFSGAFFFGSHVSKTIQSGIINPDLFISDPKILVFGMLSALLSAGIWLQIASYYGWPVSTTHSIVGALVGFGMVVGGYEAIYWKKVSFIVSSWILSPLIGGVLAYYIFNVIRNNIFYAENPVEATKKWAPLLIFFVTLILGYILIFEGLHNFNLTFSVFAKMGLMIGMSLIAALITYFCVLQMPPSPMHERLVPVYNPEVVNSLDKAKKHLGKVQSNTKGETQYTVSLLMEEIDLLSKGLEQKQEFDSSHLEYVKVEKVFGYLQIVTACMMAFAHGANDVANAIGPLSAAIAIMTTGLFAVEAPVPTWALALGGVGIVIGLATWGWRVIDTIGKKITELTPSRGFAAEFGAAATIVLASRLGLPISTTHTLVGAVLGVGFARGLGAVNLTTTRDILISWIVTVPLGAILAVLLFYPIKAVFG